jgi:hypothetical protein
VKAMSTAEDADDLAKDYNAFLTLFFSDWNHI